MSALANDGIVWHAAHDIRVEPVTLPAEPPPGWLRVRVAWCGICGTDAEEVAHGPIVIPSAPHPLLGTQPPLALGHEIAGLVVAAAGVEGFSAGDAVVSDVLLGCGECERCAEGAVNACERMAAFGLHAHGGLAGYVDLPAVSCRRLPDDVPLDVAVLAEPAAVAIRAARVAAVERGDRVLVIGAGTVGLLTVLAAVRAGAAHVVAVDPSARQRELAVPLGAHEAVAAVEDWTPGADERWRAIECSGHTPALNAALARLPWQSTLALVGIHAGEQPADLVSVVLREHRLVGSLSHDRNDFATAVELVAAEHPRLRALLGPHLDLTEGVTTLHAFADGHGPLGKAVIGSGWAAPGQTAAEARPALEAGDA